MPTYFQGNNLHPQHISVGAILVNEKGEVCCHHFYAKDLTGYYADENLDDFYILMRETLHPNETLEGALQRGLMEEFGATGELVDYVGSIEGHFKHQGVDIQKTTLYFLCKLKEQDISKRGSDDVEDEIEAKTIIEWQTVDYLIPLMKEQSVRFGRTDIDESSILERMKMLQESKNTLS